jgi:hypothetical protein
MLKFSGLRAKLKAGYSGFGWYLWPTNYRYESELDRMSVGQYTMEALRQPEAHLLRDLLHPDVGLMQVISKTCQFSAPALLDVYPVCADWSSSKFLDPTKDQLPCILFGDKISSASCYFFCRLDTGFADAYPNIQQAVLR